MRLLLELLALFFAVTTIYRRLIKPFIQGIKGERNPKSSMNDGKIKFKTAGPKKNIKHPDPKEIQDAEFEEIK